MREGFHSWEMALTFLEQLLLLSAYVYYEGLFISAPHEQRLNE